MDLIIKLTIELIVVGVVFVIGKFVLPELSSRIGEDNLLKIKTWATTFVLAIENIITSEKAGEQKFEYVYKALVEKASEIGIKLSEDDIKAIIEEAVYVMNQTKKDK